MKHFTLAGALAAVALLAACGGGGETDAEAAGPTITDAAEKCEPSEESDEFDAVDFNSDDKSIAMSVDTLDVASQVLALATVGCIVQELDGPSSIGDRVGATTAMSGPQSEDWEGFEANWSFSGSDDLLIFTVDAK